MPGSLHAGATGRHVREDGAVSLSSRLWALVDALRAHAAKGEPLLPEDVLALASALQGEAEAQTTMARDRASKAWRGRNRTMPTRDAA